MAQQSAFTRLAKKASTFTGRPSCFALALGIILVWAITGPLFGFSDTWQLVINTGTTIITFLMVFLIQNTQNRDNNALHAKLDELIRVSSGHNSFIGIENLADKELEAILSKLDEQSTRLREDSGPTPTRRTATKTGSASKAKPRAASSSRTRKSA